MATRNWNRLDYIFKLMVIIALSIYAVILLRDIVIPLAFAVFLSMVLLPIVKRIERRTGTTLAVTIVVVGGMIVFGLLGWLLVNQIIGLANDLPNLQDRADKFPERHQRPDVDRVENRSGRAQPDGERFSEERKRVSRCVPGDDQQHAGYRRPDTHLHVPAAHLPG